MTDRRTKAQLLERIEDLEKRSISLGPGPQVKPEPPARPAREGVAVSDCILAFGSLQTRPSYGSGDAQPDSAAIGRVLRLLADRYAVPLVEVREQPCSRTHVDLDQLQNAIAATVVSS